MATDEKTRGVGPAAPAILRYPDPRLQEVCRPVVEVDESVRELVARMFELMFEARGVGLAAPQVGVAVRLFVASPTCEPDDRRVYINPRIVAAEGMQEEEEGCLSFPGVACRVKRHQKVTIEATDLDGSRFQETGEGLLARIFEHESDHLDGRLLVDRMGTVARMANRKALKEMEEDFASV